LRHPPPYATIPIMLPQGWDRSTIVLLAFALPFVIAANLAQAQVFDLEHDRVQMAELHGFWRFHTGDDPDGKLGWANPAFDDSSWQLGRSDQPLDVQGCPGYSGMAWYRFQVALPANHPPLALFVPEIGTSNQEFAGGRLIGQFGGLPPHQRVYLWHAGGSASLNPALGQIAPIPADIAKGRGSLVIAIRVWDSPDFASFCAPPGSTIDPFRIGDAALISDLRQHRWNYQFWTLSADNALLLVYLLAALAGLGLFLLRPGEGEYLWFAAVELLYAAYCCFVFYPGFDPVWFQGYESLEGLLLFLRGVCLLMFFVTFLKEPRGWLFWSAIGSALIGALMFIPMVMEWMSFAAWIPVIYLAWIPFIVCQVLLLSLAARRGNLDARLLLGPFGLQWGAFLGRGLLFGIQAYEHGGSLIAFWAGKWDHLFQWPFPISVPNVADFLFQIAILAILVLRFARTRRDEERQASELEAARVVQRVLVPADVPTIRGFRIESVYKPAGQVGGDFFQIIPLPSGGVLVAIGDVSGKGMPAAMMVSLLVGRLQSLAEATNSPAEILRGLNRGLHVRSRGGFTTCLILRADPDGTLTIANAGHISPYRNGGEMAVESGLPLGLSEDASYSESRFRLDENEQLTLVTDGVVEARGKGGELFGFARTQAISNQPAEDIAHVAQSFGQDDDISVISVTRIPVGAAVLA
jgi:hypothetical protein